ncbi:MAG: hypothetical protein LW635_09710 [Microcystis sp. 53598_E5]|jgi:hypothetical protein|nr:hypothetical protein [Microcystis sp. 53598_E5]MCE2673862.1 hypothetical protein [Microcystis sp. 53598_E5]
MAPANININTGFSVDDANDNASKKWMVYEADDGTKYRVFMTETIGSFMGFDDITDTNVAETVDMPKFLRMRNVHFSDASGKVKGTYPVGKRTEFVFQEGGKITVPRRGKADGVVTFVTGSTGEKKRFFYTGDTGQQSGDAT